MSYDPYEEAMERHANEYDRRRDEVKGGDRSSVYSSYSNDEKYTAAGDRREHDPGRRSDQEGIMNRIPNYDPHEEEQPTSEPDYEAIMERRAERRRPDWAD